MTLSKRRRGDRDFTSVGVGPISLDVSMARSLGWSEDLIDAVSDSILLLARGAGSTAATERGSQCEVCGSASARRPEELPCHLCGRVADCKAVALPEDEA